MFSTCVHLFGRACVRPCVSSGDILRPACRGLLVLLHFAVRPNCSADLMRQLMAD